MKPSIEQLTAIAFIGRDTTMRGKGISIANALEQTQYLSLRKDFSETDLIPILNANPELLNDWRLFSEDKRTEGGFYLTEQEIGQRYSTEKIQNDNLTELTAKYILLELDFWADI